MFWGEPRRESIPQSLRTKLLLKCRGKCEICGLDFDSDGVKPQIHHKDGDPSNNRLSNLIVVCPNCHSKLHKWKEVKKVNIFGFTERRRKLVVVKPKKSKKEKRSKKSKTKKSKHKKRSEPESPWDFNLLGNITF